MNQPLQHLMDWSEWGRQWVQYLRNNPEMSAHKKHLVKFEAAFTEIGRRAAHGLTKDGGKSVAEPEIRHLTAQAEDVQTNFHQFLRLVQDSRYEPASGWLRLGSEENHPTPEEPVPTGEHKLPPLPYSYDALEPYIDSETMRLHHDRHHKSYVDGLNKAEQMMALARSTNEFDLIKHWEREAAFHGAGHYLHTLFWNIMSPGGGRLSQGPLLTQINNDFGSFDAFKRHFSKAAETVEGGGWALLVWSTPARRLEILQAEKHQNHSQWENVPLLVLDVWEHAYYLSYRNNRQAYIDAWWNVVNWSYVEQRFEQAQGTP
ncbi:superoxide dismutase [Brevibacillus dissolubilis]|uniref:superoxide dismutase n=1 Tax=Brevibacillus dissolubilis TaxID=1844116 RepID=UPI00111738AB|nr:superoxide dismutase [Brevibacillus dissolubilis]